ncbi:NAD(P)-binding Rossmann-fold containing protein [Penicillium odoratum]|uniref:NAD(P)-binding Rossmann-fold containing protein n=1 Tax=Penicillium odoratum TaxID=1167516 RepID=UPI0025491317|nr:NAD(P)-binding Rossmann-fold containing protein [Penicillium odoratum]KAJ5760396.1 NAD(P)-binding Rossmann-fold containing protein [Penicillium odoratum]
MSFVQGKTAIVTGAGSGICFAFTKILLDHGCNVVLGDLALRPEAEELVKLHSIPKHPTAIFHRTDVRNWQDIEFLFKTAQEEFGRIDIVCPGAGIFEPSFSNFWVPPGTGESRDDPLDSRYSTLDINLTHPVRMSQQAIQHFTKAKTDGFIVHISSVAAQHANFFCPMYAASKHAISGFVRSLAMLDHPPEGRGLTKIRVNAVAPGVIKTPLWTESRDRHMFDEDKDEWVSPEYVAEQMLQLVLNPEYEGGTVLEVGKTVRKVEILNDPGPLQEGNSLSNRQIADNEVWGKLQDLSSGQTM